MKVVRLNVNVARVKMPMRRRAIILGRVEARVIRVAVRGRSVRSNHLGRQGSCGCGCCRGCRCSGRRRFRQLEQVALLGLLGEDCRQRRAPGQSMLAGQNDTDQRAKITTL